MVSKQSLRGSETGRLCERGCGFFGSPGNRNLCSKCYTDFLKEEIVKTTSPMKIPKIPIFPWAREISVDNVAVKGSTCDNNVSCKKNRCQCCNKRVGLTGFGCRCGGTFCGFHRYPEEHACKSDYKAIARAVLAKENPVVKGDRLQERA